MGEVVNLRLARKRAARAAGEEAAARNRIRHGIAKADRKIARLEAERTNRMLDGTRLGGTPEAGAKAGEDPSA